MKIINDTNWRTDHLREFVRRVADEELEPEKRKHVRVHFVSARWSGPNGYAVLKGTYTRIRLPKDGMSKSSLASLLAHEFAHLHGHEGERWMRKSTRYGSGEKSRDWYAWANDLPLEKKPVRVKHKPTADEKDSAKLLAVMKAIARWEAKRKRAVNALRKYTTRKRYYERKLSARAAAKISEPAEPENQ
jgi:hypothetical protein